MSALLHRKRKSMSIQQTDISVVDFHTHTFPERIAGRALAKLQAASHIEAFADGTDDGLVRSMLEAGIDLSVILPVATAPSQVASINDAAMRRAEERQAKLAKPPGSLGKLEDISIRLAGITGSVVCTLIGYTDTGKKEYETKVTYWMPFEGNGIGFHDAPWQPDFGGDMYATGYGSHGCVNLSSADAQELYSIIEIGDVVVVHS